MTQATVSETFSVGSPARVSVSNIRGTVDVRAGAEGEVSVAAVRHVDSGDARHTKIEIAQAADGSVNVATRFQPDWLDWIFSLGLDARQPCRVDYVVRVPRRCDVSLSTVSGSALIDGVDGETSLRAVSGDTVMTNVSGGLTIDGVSGDVRGERVQLSGPLRLKMVSGEVRLAESTVPGLDGKTVSGDITLETALGDGPYRLTSVSGLLRFIMPAQTGCQVEVRGVSADLHSELPLSRRTREAGRVSAAVGDGGPAISLSAVSGDLHLELAGGRAAPAAPASDAPADRLSVLEQLERGDLSVAEALERLKQ